MERITEHITRLWIPFEKVMTSVFLVTTDEGVAILDTATTHHDVGTYILPALTASPALIFASHSHSDHMGGLPTLAECFPEAKIAFYDVARLEAYPENRRLPLADGDLLLDCLRILHTPGHSPDSLSIFDERTCTLLTFDATQGFGVGRFGSGISHAADYLESLNRMAALDAAHLAAAHDFMPVGTTAHGSRAVNDYLRGCRAAISELLEFVKTRLPNSPEEISTAYVKAYPNRPPLTPWGVEKLLNFLKNPK